MLFQARGLLRVGEDLRDTSAFALDHEEDDVEVLRVARGEGEEAVNQRLRPGARRAPFRNRLLEEGDQAVVALDQEFRVERLLAGEVEVEGARREFRRLGDPGHGRAVIAVLPEEAARDAKDVFPSLSLLPFASLARAHARLRSTIRN